MTNTEALEYFEDPKMGDKYLCYCSKVTHKNFREKLSNNNFSSLESLCDNLKLAKHCAACLPNIEDEFFKLKGKKVEIKKTSTNYDGLAIKDKVKRFIDKLSGNVLVTQHGYLPMLGSKSVKTWLVISNEKPSLIDAETIDYKIALTIFSSKGEKINHIDHLLKSNKNIKICLNNYLPKIKRTR